MYKNKLHYYYSNSAKYANTVFVNSSKHLVGDCYSTKHKMEVGSVLMIIGVLIATFTPVHIVADLVGYFIHALGATPIIEYITLQTKQQKKHVNTTNKRKLPR